MSDNFAGVLPQFEVRSLDDVTPIPALRLGHCDQCGVNHGDPFKRFCSAECRDRWWNVAVARGKRLYPLAYLERRFRYDGDVRRWGMNGRCRLLDLYIADDRAREAARSTPLKGEER